MQKLNTMPNKWQNKAETYKRTLHSSTHGSKIKNAKTTIKQKVMEAVCSSSSRKIGTLFQEGLIVKKANKILN